MATTKNDVSIAEGDRQRAVRARQGPPGRPYRALCRRAEREAGSGEQENATKRCVFASVCPALRAPKATGRAYGARGPASARQCLALRTASAPPGHDRARPARASAPPVRHEGTARAQPEPREGAAWAPRPRALSPARARPGLSPSASLGRALGEPWAPPMAASASF